jgi:hypothetical protein
MFLARTLIICTVTLTLSCEDKLYKEKYDVNVSITNKTNSPIAEIKFDGANGAKVWVFRDTQPGKTEELKFNIKRDFKVPEGGFMITAISADGDSLSLNTGYFTNWYYQGPIPAKFNIYNDRIEEAK